MADTARPSAIDEVARQIIEQETAGSDDPARVAAGVEAALGHLQALFSNVIGGAGFEGVLARSIHLPRDGVKPGNMRTLDALLRQPVGAARAAETSSRTSHQVD